MEKPFLIEHRKDARVGVSFPIACNMVQKSRYFYTISKDLSSQGIKILTDSFIPRGDIIKINLNMINREIHLKAKVRWCNKERYADRYCAGLFFEEISQNDRAAISNLTALSGKDSQ